MITLSKDRTVKSSWPGVAYRVKTATHADRIEIDLAAIEHNQEARALIDAARAELKGKSESSPEYLKVLAQVQTLEQQVRIPIVLRRLLLEVQGISLDGVTAISVEDFISMAPSGFIEEAYAACMDGFGLTAEQQKN